MPWLSIDPIQISLPGYQGMRSPDCASVENVLSLAHRKICLKQSRLYQSSGSLVRNRGLAGAGTTVRAYARQLDRSAEELRCHSVEAHGPAADSTMWRVKALLGDSLIYEIKQLFMSCATLMEHVGASFTRPCTRGGGPDYNFCSGTVAWSNLCESERVVSLARIFSLEFYGGL